MFSIEVKDRSQLSYGVSNLVFRIRHRLYYMNSSFFTSIRSKLAAVLNSSLVSFKIIHVILCL